MPPTVYQGNYNAVGRLPETELFPILRENNSKSFKMVTTEHCEARVYHKRDLFRPALPFVHSVSLCLEQG